MNNQANLNKVQLRKKRKECKRKRRVRKICRDHKWTITVEEVKLRDFRRAIGLSEGSIREWGEFMKRLINALQNDVNEIVLIYCALVIMGLIVYMRSLI